MKKIISFIKTNYIYLLYFITLITLALLIVDKNYQYDFYFDYKSGESIINNGLDFLDHFSFIKRLTYLYHHFLYDIIIYYVVKFCSYKVVYYLFFLYFIITALVIFKSNKKDNEKILPMIVSIITMLSIMHCFTERVHSITYLFFFLEVIFLEKLYDTGNKKYSIYLLILSILIVNLHMSFWLFTIILALPYLLETIISNINNKKINKLLNINKPKNIKQVYITFILLLLSAFISPFGIWPYKFTIISLLTSGHSFIQEMQQTVVIQYKLYIVYFVILIFGIYTKKIKLTFRDLVLLIGLFIFALLTCRNIAYLYLIFPTIIYKYIDINDINLNKKCKNLLYIISSIFIFMTLILVIYYTKEIDKQKGGSYNLLQSVINYVIENVDDYKNQRFYTSFNYGSYLLYYDIPVFVDNRAEVYLKEYNGGKDIMGDYSDTEKEDKYYDILKKYNMNYIIVCQDDKMYKYIKNNNEFEVLYENKVCSLYYKESYE